ncbi:B3 domain-containing transcription factor VRN1, partial [Mucuna pruriens]
MGNSIKAERRIYRSRSCMATKYPPQPQPQGKLIHFFKIITVHNLHEGKLLISYILMTMSVRLAAITIPNKFVEKYGEGLSNTLFLKTPNGAEWKLNLEKRDGKIWFQKGWKEFAEYHSLAHGHLLVFRCQRTSHFQVYIHDLSALEIDYPFKEIEGKTTSNIQGNKPPNDENLEYHRPGQKRKDNSSLECLQLYQMMRSKCAKVENSLVLPKKALHHTDTKCKEKSKVVANQVTALDRASSVKACNPFFLVVMRPSYVHSNGGPLNLPAEFCRRHFGLHKKQRHINLQVLNGRIWPAKYTIQIDNTRAKFRLSSGWKAFVKHNNLKVGDFCTFELIDATKLTFLVLIFRETDSSNCSTSQESDQLRTACQRQRKEMKTITATK